MPLAFDFSNFTSNTEFVLTLAYARKIYHLLKTNTLVYIPNALTSFSYDHFRN